MDGSFRLSRPETCQAANCSMALWDKSGVFLSKQVEGFLGMAMSGCRAPLQHSRQQKGSISFIKMGGMKSCPVKSFRACYNSYVRFGVDCCR